MNSGMALYDRHLLQPFAIVLDDERCNHLFHHLLVSHVDGSRRDAQLLCHLFLLESRINHHVGNLLHGAVLIMCGHSFCHLKEKPFLLVVRADVFQHHIRRLFALMLKSLVVGFQCVEHHKMKPVHHPCGQFH